MPKDTDAAKPMLHEDYYVKPPKFRPTHIDLDVQIHDIDDVDVTAEYHYEDTDKSEAQDYIELDFEDLKKDPNDKSEDLPSLVSIEIDGENVAFSFDAETKKLKFKAPEDKDSFVLTTRTNIDPKNNTTGVGLYMSDGNIFFKGETMNFRKIAPVQDRTDVLSTFNVYVAYDVSKDTLQNYNHLVSNGIKVDEGTNQIGYRFAAYEDTTPKPCYLMGLNAGAFVLEEHEHKFSNDHTVKIYTYVPEKDAGKDHHLVKGIKAGMEYFDKEFGLIYDKPEYHVSVLSVFNAGATETKGMPLFACCYGSAHKDYVSYAELLNAEMTAIHEYIHEFIGDGFYIPSWLELGTKEGLTVFMEDLATEAMLADKDILRMEAMNGMINSQFPEEDRDKVPPIPQSLKSERAHYTSTTYSKGAECFRMMYTLMGYDAFKDLIRDFVLENRYKTAGIDDLLAMAEKQHGYDFTTKFKRWFRQAGRASVKSVGAYDKDSQEYTITLEQSFKEYGKSVLPIPLDIALCIDGKMDHQQLYIFDKENDTIRIPNVTKEPDTYSINRGFTAPVDINHDRSAEEMLTLLECETNGVTQQQIIQDLHNNEILSRYDSLQKNEAMPLISNNLLKALKKLVNRDDIEPDVLAKLLMPTAYAGLRTMVDKAAPLNLTKARQSYLEDIAYALQGDLCAKYKALRSSLSAEYEDKKEDHQKRVLSAVLLNLISRVDSAPNRELVKELYDTANNGQDRLTALSLLGGLRKNDPKTAEKIEDDCLKYMSQDTNGTLNALEIISAQTTDDPRGLLTDILTNPKYNYDWIIPHHGKMVARYFAANYETFHHPSGDAYEAIADMAIQAGKMNNGEVADAIGLSLTSLNQFDDETAAKMFKALERIHKTPGMPNQLEKSVADAVEEYNKRIGTKAQNSCTQSCTPQ